MTLPILDRYLLREWSKIFFITMVAFPLFAIIIELTDKLDEYLAKGIEPSAIALSYVFSLPEKLSLTLPAAVLFATVFSLGAFSRHAELDAAKASGRSFHRTVLPLLGAALLASGAALATGELAPPATRRQLELLGELERRSQNARYNFVYRAERGWVYAIRELDVKQRRMRDIVLEREGSGAAYPTLAVQARRATYVDSTDRWTLVNGRFRIVSGSPEELSVAFDSLRMRSLTENPEALLGEPKKPQEMRYRELGRYVEALERSGGDGRILRVERALKLAVPMTCLIIAMFGAPLAIAGPRGSATFGIAVSLGTTIIFLILVQLSRAIGAGGLLPPGAAAWLPNAVFGVAGLVMLQRAPT